MNKKKGIPLWHPAYGVLLAYMVLSAACMSVFTYAGSLFITPMAEDFGVAVGTISLRQFTNGISSIIVLSFVDKLYKKFGFKRTTIAGMIFYCLGFVGYALSPNVYVFLACGLIQGVGTSLALLTPGAYMIMAWFQKGASIAFMLGGLPTTLIASAITPGIASMIATHGWRYTTIFAAVVSAIPAIIVCLLFADPTPESKGKRPFGWEEGQDTQATDEAASSGPMVVRGVSIKNAKKSPLLYMFIFITITSTLSMNIMRFASPLAVQSGFTEAMAAKSISVYSAAATVALIICAFLVEKMGNKRYALVFGSVNFIALFLLMYNGGNFTLFTIGLSCCAIQGMQYMQSLAPRDVFGIMDYAPIYALLNIGSNIGNMFGASAFGYVYDFTGSYNAVLWAYGILLLLAMVFTVIIYKKKDTLTWEERVGS